MKLVELRRHAEKDPKGTLTKRGIEASISLGKTLPKFSKVISSDSDRARLTARLIANLDPQIDTRASMWMANPEKSEAINELAAEKSIMFLEAMYLYNDVEVLEGTSLRAKELNDLISQLFIDLGENENGLIISHDLSISAAMKNIGIKIEAIAPLEGYIIYEDGSIKASKL